MSNNLTLKHARLVGHQYGFTINRKEEGEYRVNLKDGSEATAYYTNDLIDAILTGVEMIKHQEEQQR